MTILVTGGCGYVGSQLCHLLKAEGIEFVILDDLSTGSLASPPAGASVYQSDFASEDVLREIFSSHPIESCIHLAAKKSVAESFEKPDLYFEHNANKTQRLLRGFCEQGGRYFLYSSTAAVYGEAGDEPIDESRPCRPINPYGMSKLAGEYSVADVCNAHGVSYVIMRYFNVAGADPAGRTGEVSSKGENLFNVITQVVTGVREYVPIFGTDYDTPDGSCIRDYIHVYDLAEAHISALEYLRKAGASTSLNCGYGRGFSVKMVIEAFSSALDRTVPTRNFPRRPGDPAKVVADPRRMRSLLEWRPSYAALIEIVRSELDWTSLIRTS